MEVQRVVRGSPDQVEELMKITLELGARRIEQRIRVDRFSRLVIGFEEDDFGQLCPWIGQEDKRLKHCDGRAAKIVQRDHHAIVLPQARLDEGAAFATEQQQSVARARQQGQSRTGAARQGHRDHQVAGRGDRDASRTNRPSQEDQQDQQGAAIDGRQDRSMQEHSHRQGGQSKGSHNLENCARRVAAKSSKNGNG